MVSGKSSCAIQVGFKMNSQPLSCIRFDISFLQAAFRFCRSSSYLSTFVSRPHLDRIELDLLLHSFVFFGVLLACVRQS